MNLKNILALTLVFTLAVFAQKDEKVKYWQLQIGEHTLSEIELAITAEQQIKGLMFREKLNENQGMLFVQENEQIMNFWMKNTLIPLDLIYLDKNGIIVKIHQMKVEKRQQQNESIQEYELRLPTYSSEKLAMYALELKAGMAEILNLKTGDKIELHQKELQQIIK